MRAISLHQPWASLVAHGLKRFETRSWTTSYRGPLAIHAAKRKVVIDELNAIIEEALYDAGYRYLPQLPYGCIVCTCELVAVCSTNNVKHLPAFKQIAETELYFGDYSPGRFAWQLDNVQIVDNIPARGSQGFWEWIP